MSDTTNPSNEEATTTKKGGSMKLGAKLLFIVLLLVIAGGGFVAWNEIQTKQATIDDLELKNSELTQDSEKLKQQAAACEESKQQVSTALEQIQQADCKGIWTPGKGCEEPPKVFTAPIGGETFCFGKTVDVKWDPNLIKEESVDILLATSGNAGKLATLQSSEGVYHWPLEQTHKAEGGGGFTIAPGLYKLSMQTPVGKLLAKDTDLFTIKKCGDTTAAKPVKKTAAPAKKTAAPAKKTKAPVKKKH